MLCANQGNILELEVTRITVGDTREHVAGAQNINFDFKTSSSNVFPCANKLIPTIKLRGKNIYTT